MPNRILRESICTSASVDALSPGAELLLYRLIVRADDFGRFHGDPRLVLAACFPRRIGRVREKAVRAWLLELVGQDTIRLYRGPDLYLYFPSWQQRSRANASKFPPPPDDSQGRGDLLTDDGQTTAICQTDDGHMSPEVRGVRNEARGARNEVRGSRIEATAASAANGQASKPSDMQTYFLQELQGGGSGKWEAFTFGALVEANKEFGRAVVTTVLGHAKTRLVEESFEPETPYAWFRKACSEAVKEGAS